MIIDLKSIFVNENASKTIDYSLDLSDVEFSGVYPLKKPVKISGTVSNKASLVRLEAVISYEYDAPCDRCGTDTTTKYSVKVDKSLAASIEGEESDTILLVPDMKLNLEEFLYSETIVSLPMKHLCKEDCKGLCTTCGQNLNDGSCDCERTDLDPRMAKILDIFSNFKEV